MDCPLSISNLLCQEDSSDLDSVLECPADGVAFLLLSDEEYVQNLVSRESSLEMQSLAELPAAEGWFKRARSDVIKWILATKACFGFGIRTAYLAVAYLDRFFMARRLDKDKSWAVRLVSMACLSVAAKMEELRAPALSELPEMDGYAFDSDTVRRMELLLLGTLQWRMNCVTPFDYLSYFVAKFQSEPCSEELICKAIGFIFAFFDAINLAAHRASTIAAAAVLAASSKPYTKQELDSKMSAVSFFASYSEKEDVVSCYNIMIQDSPKSSTRRTPKRMASSEASTEAYYSSITDAVDSKRRRPHLP